jgi:hypothetical protein
VTVSVNVVTAGTSVIRRYPLNGIPFAPYDGMTTVFVMSPVIATLKAASRR